ncbi:MAG: ATPase [Betaproteobacteria bacterium]|nr:ATPase [Betaproteobacteria bacterium]
MEDLLKSLLQAEALAEAEVAKANAERERIIQEALEQARRAEDQFAAGVAELRAPYLGQAEERATQAVAELKRKYGERHQHLRTLAEEREQAAADAAFAILLDPGKN